MMSGLDNPEIQKTQAIDEYAGRARKYFNELPGLTDEERQQIMGRLNTAVLTKTRELIKKEKGR